MKQTKILKILIVLAMGVFFVKRVYANTCQFAGQQAVLEIEQVTIDGQQQTDRSAYQRLRIQMVSVPVGQGEQPRVSLYVTSDAGSGYYYGEQFNAVDASRP